MKMFCLLSAIPNLSFGRGVNIMKNTLLTILWLFSLASQLLAQTNITNDDITTSTTWNISDSPFIIKNSITVNTGVSLTIDPGVEVRFDGSHSISVFGRIGAVGTSTNQIHLPQIRLILVHLIGIGS